MDSAEVASSPRPLPELPPRTGGNARGGSVFNVVGGFVSPANSTGRGGGAAFAVNTTEVAAPARRTRRPPEM